MPIAKVQLPDGRIAKIEVPEGSTEQDVMSFVQTQFAGGANVDELLKKERTDQSSLTLDEKKQLVTARGAGAIPSINPATLEESAASVAKDMPFYEKAWTGFGSTLPRAGTAIKQMANDLNLGGAKDSAVKDAQLRQQESDNSRALDALGGWGTTGRIAGNIALSAPAMLIPGANTAIGSTAIGGMLGSLDPVGTGESRLRNFLFGSVGGLGGHALGKGINKTVQAATNKVGNIEAKVAAKASADAASATATARSAAGNAAQNAYKQLEHLRELGAMRALTPDEALIAANLEKELAGKAAEKLLPAVAQKEATSAAYKEAMETEAKRAAELMANRLGGGEVKNQIMARVKRYGPAVAGGVVGNLIFPGLGGSVGGAATGLVLRPAVRSMMNLAKNPAVQHALLSPVAKSPNFLRDPAIARALGLLAPSTYAAQ